MPADRFESTVDAIISGNLPALNALLAENPELLHARSARSHRATLLHYTAANGVEQHRQKTPAKAVDVARTLLRAGAEVDALADMYDRQHTTLELVVSSTPPAEAGVQIPLVHVLADYGAALQTPLTTALAHGFRAAAEALVERGAGVDTLPAAAGLGHLTLAARMLSNATPEDRHRALALASQHGHTEIVRLLLHAGEDPNRYNPAGFHGHSTPLHQAALAGHAAVVDLLLSRGARMDIEDTVYHGTALGWAIHAGQTAIEARLRAHGRH